MSPETKLFLLEHGGPMLLLLLLGGSMGSFLNVVVDRGSRGVSIVRPGSQCPNCGLRLRFGRENLPLLGWLLLRGRCRQCRLAIPLRYLLMEWGVAFAFVGVYQLAFDPFGCGGTMDPWLEATGARESAFFFLGVLALMSGFFAAGAIDFRTYHIPMWITTALALSMPVFLLAQGLVEARPIGGRLLPVPLPGWVGVGSAIGGALGALLANGLLWRGVLPTSFTDYDEYVEDGAVLAEYPHARREMGKELVFCSIIVAGFAIGGLFTKSFQHSGDPPVWLAAASAGVIGWASGAAVVWLVRIAGTLWLGQEAMGLGDVHLMGAAGALLGWFAPLLAFALAPFVALCWLSGLAVVQKCRGRWSGELPPMPFGPHLAIATMAVVLGHRPIQAAWEAWFGEVLPWPQ